VKNRDLIAHLQQFPADLDVFLYNEEDSTEEFVAVGSISIQQLFFREGAPDALRFGDEMRLLGEPVLPKNNAIVIC